MIDPTELERRIREAFASVEFPGDWCLTRSKEGEEPLLLAQEFKGKNDWRSLDAAFLDQAPDGYASALSFFSDEAFRFYLPAYLLADLQGALRSTDVVFHLCFGLDDESRDRPVNPRRYGDRTWFTEATHRLSVFSREQAAAIVLYLLYKLQTSEIVDFDRPKIEGALRSFWLQRAGEAGD